MKRTSIFALAFLFVLTLEDLSDLGRAGDWSDRTYSIRLFGRATVVGFRDIGFRRASIVVDRDVPDLSRLQEKASATGHARSLRFESRGAEDTTETAGDSGA